MTTTTPLQAATLLRDSYVSQQATNTANCAAQNARLDVLIAQQNTIITNLTPATTTTAPATGS